MALPASPPARRGLLLSPAVLILVLAIMVGASSAAVTIFYRLGNAQERLSRQDIEVVLWAAIQLDKEARRLDDTLRVWRNGDTNFADVSTRLDLLFSRIDYYKHGNFGQPPGAPPPDADLVGEIEKLVESIDPIIGNLPQSPDIVADVRNARRALREVEQRSARLVNLANQRGGDERTEVRRESSLLYRALGWSALVLVTAVLLALGMLLAQNRSLNRARKRAEVIGAELRAAAIAAEAGARSKVTFLTTMSHEIRTPMNGVLGAASLLGAGKLEPDQRRQVDMIAACGQALLSLIDDILDFARLDAGRTEFTVAEFAPEDLVEMVADITAPLLREKSVDLIATHTTNMPARIGSDAHRLRQVLVNLVANAIKFTDQGAVVLLLDFTTTADGKPFLAASVVDTGIGMDPSTIAGLFREFQQGPEGTNRRYGGTGLGLAICKRIVQSLGGRIGVESTLGRGSRFWFEVPVEVMAPPNSPPPRGAATIEARSPIVVDGLRALLQSAGFSLTAQPTATTLILCAGDVPEPKSPPAGTVLRIGGQGGAGSPITPRRLLALLDSEPRNAPAPEPVHTGGKSLRVLVAEDNAMNREVMEQVLAMLGHTVMLAANGREAVDLLASGAVVDVALIDLQMPVMNGLEATRAIRALPGPASRTPIVAVTANAMQDDRAGCLAAGMNGFLAKPITIARLRAMLDDIAGANPDAGPVTLSPTAETGVIDHGHRDALAAALRPGSLERLASGFWDDIGADFATLTNPATTATERDERLHRIAGAASTLGYAALAAAAQAQRGREPIDPTALLATLRLSLAADAASLPPELLQRVSAELAA